MIHFHPLFIKDIRRETDECVSIAFDVPDNVRDKYLYTQGQSLTIRTILNGQEVRRTYSLCSSPLDNEWRIAVKKVEGGLFSTFANHELEVGDMLEVMPPVGKFYTPLDPRQKKHYVAIAAGSGITPVLSIISTTLRTEPASTFTLVYGNRTRSSIIFKEELDALKNRFMNRFTVHHILSREQADAPVYFGRIDGPKCDLLFSKLVDLENVDEFFICGPEQMIFCVRDFLEKKGIEKNKIHFELFTIPGERSSVVKRDSSLNKTNQGPVSRISVKLDGILFDFDLGMQGQSILDAALAQGADLPYACKGGVCCTCKARLLEGKVQMEVNYGLEPDEIEQGFILTCQSHPLTPVVSVDFDVR
ncbi:MAG TPA: 1,2-phenylacetyl-CoA epoxidase subunit PaaE [Chitinophagaceae bacterium]|nr:1,2-phenylacetyl-CoA epoxidase subunit PaaE [Chitinophagaceae bacterium]